MVESEDTKTPRCDRRIALLLEYDGASYAGSQLQKNGPTIQSVLEEAIIRVTQSHSRVAFAGRTDAGVHARGQVASFVTSTQLETPSLRHALNARLPEDVAVRDVADVAADFDPRRQALRRCYRYLVHDGPTRPVLARSRVWHPGGSLDVEAMSQAAASLTGEHDFAAFASALDRRGASTIRNLHEFTVRRKGALVIIEAVANAFLPHQVRRMVGALVKVGKGRLTPEEYAALLSGVPASVGPAAPARGLCLMRVEYASPLFEVGLDSDVVVC